MMNQRIELDAYHYGYEKAERYGRLRSIMQVILLRHNSEYDPFDPINICEVPTKYIHLFDIRIDRTESFRFKKYFGSQDIIDELERLYEQEYSN